jgi:hypothetical protein
MLFWLGLKEGRTVSFRGHRFPLGNQPPDDIAINDAHNLDEARRLLADWYPGVANYPNYKQKELGVAGATEKLWGLGKKHLADMILEVCQPPTDSKKLLRCMAAERLLELIDELPDSTRLVHICAEPLLGPFGPPDAPPRPQSARSTVMRIALRNVHAVVERRRSSTSQEQLQPGYSTMRLPNLP